MSQRQGCVGLGNSRAWVGSIGGAASVCGAGDVARDRSGRLAAHGDVARADEQGRLTIVDHSKELIIKLRRQEHVAGERRELRSACRLIEHVGWVGNDQPYSVALFVLDPRGRRKLIGRGRPRRRGQARRRARQLLPRAHRADQALTHPRPGMASGRRRAAATLMLRRKPIAHKYALHATQPSGCP
jgi:hypothetical protein